MDALYPSPTVITLLNKIRIAVYCSAPGAQLLFGEEPSNYGSPIEYERREQHETSSDPKEANMAERVVE